MKKYIILIALIFPLTSHAMVYGFMDGKYYDETYKLKYFCFMDRKCYDVNYNYVPIEVITGENMPDKKSYVGEGASIAQPISEPAVDYPKCIDLPIVGSSDGALTTCKYFIRKPDGDLQTQVVQVKFVAEVLNGKASKKIVLNTGNAVYLDKENIQVK